MARRICVRRATTTGEEEENRDNGNRSAILLDDVLDYDAKHEEEKRGVRSSGEVPFSFPKFLIHAKSFEEYIGIVRNLESRQQIFLNFKLNKLFLLKQFNHLFDINIQ